MARRILHLSDLHTGTAAPSVLAEFRELIGRLAPQILVVTGDLTHRGRRADLERAHELLTSLDVPFLAVPGNHDLPYVLPKRFTRTHEEWIRVFGTTRPSFTSDGIAVVGLNSTRPWRHQGGAVPASELEHLARAFEQTEAGALRVVALHHHLAAPPWRVVHKRPLHRREYVLDRLASAGVELVLSGHVHQSSITERREFAFVEHDRGWPMVLVTVAGFGQPRPHRSEAVGFNVYEYDEENISVLTYCWAPEGGFHEVGRRSFRRA